MEPEISKKKIQIATVPIVAKKAPGDNDLLPKFDLFKVNAQHNNQYND